MRQIRSIVWFGFVAGCGGGGSAVPPALQIQLALTRIDDVGLDPVRGTIRLSRSGQPIVGAQPGVLSSEGVVAAVSEVGGGDYQFVVTPSQTGEHAITVSFDGQSLTRTALVLGEVSAEWGQPMMVEGLVNSAGYEDGVTVTPDGQYLFVQYGPWRFSALLLFDLPRASGGAGGNRLVPSRFTHRWMDTVLGPTTAPQRPGFFDGRIFDGELLHNSNLWQVGADMAPNFAPITMFYGFRRQIDGSYAEPFYVAFQDLNDAIMNPFGLSFRLHSGNQATILFALDDPAEIVKVDKNNNGIHDVDSRFDIYTYELTLGVDNSLGTYQAGNPPTPGALFPSTMLNFGTAGTEGIYGTQGNPHLHARGDGTIVSVFTDDEFDHADADPDNDADHGDISAYVLTSGVFPSGAWGKVVLPTTVNGIGDQIQPFFDRDGLYFTEDVNIRYCAFTGTDSVADYGDDSKWSSSTIVLGKDTTANAVGKIIGVGEPTLATIEGKRHLFFVYVRVRGFDSATGVADLDMQAGFVPHR